MTSPSGKDELRALVALLTTSVDAVLNSDTPLPSLNSTDATQLKRTPEVQTALAACAQLSALLEGPAAVGRFGLSFHLPACIRVAIEAHVAEAIREGAAGGGGEGVHVTDIAQASNINKDKLARVLRFLASQHIFRETAQDTFANNRLSIALDTGKPVSSLINGESTSFYCGTSGVQTLLAHCGDEGMKASAVLAESLAAGDAYDADHTAFNKAMAFEGNAWMWLNREENSGRFDRFGWAMKGSMAWLGADEGDILNGFDFASLADQAQVVDVGGGVGSVSLALTHAFPNLRLVVQDQATVINGEAQVVWAKHAPDSLTSGRVTLTVHDFFSAQPVKDAAVYLMRFIMHDWTDDKAIEILTRLREAAGPESRLILIEQLVGPLCVKDKEVLLAAKNALPYFLDIHMMTMIDAQERSLAQYESLGAAAGWKLERVHSSQTGTLHQLVFTPA